MNTRGWIARITAAAKGLAARLQPKPPPAMMGTPPSARKLTAIPADPVEHAKDFALRFYEPLEAVTRKRFVRRPGICCASLPSVRRLEDIRYSRFRIREYNHALSLGEAKTPRVLRQPVEDDMIRIPELTGEAFHGQLPIRTRSSRTLRRSRYNSAEKVSRSARDTDRVA
jgi:hypothetical protein